jgi:hypothetical protein
MSDRKPSKGLVFFLSYIAPIIAIFIIFIVVAAVKDMFGMLD